MLEVIFVLPQGDEFVIELLHLLLELVEVGEHVLSFLADAVQLFLQIVNDLLFDEQVLLLLLEI